MRFNGNAPRIAEVATITVGGTWAANDTIKMAQGFSSIPVTVGTPHATSDVAALIAACWNAAAPVTGAAGSCPVGGLQKGEFAEIIASANGSVVSFTTRLASDTGKPFADWLLVTVTSSASGTITGTTKTVAASHESIFTTAANWEGAVAPADGDTLRFENCGTPIKWGLPTSIANMRHDIYHYQTHTGAIGLPPANVDNPAFPYAEYRQLFPVFTDGGTPADSIWQFGLGDGAGCSYIKITYVSGSSHKVNLKIYNTALVHSGPLPELIIDLGTKADATIYRGRVQIQGPGGTVNTGYRSDPANDVILTVDSTNANCTYTFGGGQILLRGGSGTPTIAMNQFDGSAVTIQDLVVSMFDPVLNGGVCVLNGTITLHTLTEVNEAVLDLSQGVGVVTITNSTLARTAELRDPLGRAVYTNPAKAGIVSGAGGWRGTPASR
jgi:hypothetical protein